MNPANKNPTPPNTPKLNVRPLDCCPVVLIDNESARQRIKGFDFAEIHEVWSAIAEGFIPTVDHALKSGVPLTIRSTEGYSMLHIAVWCKQRNMVSFLLERGVSLYIPRDIQFGQRRSAVTKDCVFLDGPSDLMNGDDSYKRYPTHMAAYLGYDEILRVLLDHMRARRYENLSDPQGACYRAAPEQSDYVAFRGFSSYHHTIAEGAIYRNHIETLKLLVTSRARRTTNRCTHSAMVTVVPTPIMF